MNLHAVAAPIIGIVNPNVQVTIQFSLGTYTTAADGTKTPNYSAPTPMMAQVQPMSWRDLMQVDGLNLQGTKFSIYLYGTPQAVVRLTQKGGDLITLVKAGYGYPAGSIFLTAIVLETFTDWSKVGATLQNGS